MNLKSLLPLGVFAAIAVALGVGLTLSPRDIPSALINEPVPDFQLTAVLENGPAMSNEALKTGKPVVVNIFASWCAPCRVEHPQLMALKDLQIAEIHGIAYKDEPEFARRFLSDLGDPYDRTGDDFNGRVGIEWGVYGVPETFIVDGEGRIRYKHIGPVMDYDLEEDILPILKELGAGR